ncbi:dehydrogenase/reductase SDR family member 4 [Bacillus rossius redtenbacheri]|uniref:dehydrogenase/reductase SDR family member 4 n=1 Tax=Bacillus rossius redtenbacheri TaxID=93214 RepID=UPI002FDDD31B
MLNKYMCRFYIPARNMCASNTKSMLTGKVAVVTASTDGIGYAIAARLAADGARVVVSSRKEGNVRSAVDRLKAGGFPVAGVVCHVGRAEDRSRLFQEAVHRFGGIDILVSNAAVNPAVGPVLECKESEWDKIFDINVKSAYLLSKEVLPHMRKRNGGSIIYISSIAGFQPMPLLGTYSVSKTALLGLTKAAAADLAKENIRVNCVAPGIVRTRFSSAIHEDEGTRTAVLSQVPLGRLAEPREIAGLVSFLCSDDASYITGETVVAAGGMQSRL